MFCRHSSQTRTMTGKSDCGYALRGTLVHCPRLGVVEFLRDQLLGGRQPVLSSSTLILTPSVVDERGIITRLSPAGDSDAAEYIKQNTVETIPSGNFLIPTFCDLHHHAPQFMYRGTGLDLPLMQWLDKYAYKAEESLDSNPDLARKVYQQLARRLIEAGTGAVLLFGTINSQTKFVRAHSCEASRLRIF